MGFYLGSLVAVLAAAVWLVVMAFRTDKRWGLACICLPPVIPVFVVRHWQRAARPFAYLLIASGLLIGATEYAHSRGQGQTMTGVWREQKGALVVRVEKGGDIVAEPSGKTGRWKRLTRDTFLLEAFEPYSGGNYDPHADTLYLNKTGVGKRGPWTIKTPFVRADAVADEGD